MHHKTQVMNCSAQSQLSWDMIPFKIYKLFKLQIFNSFFKFVAQLKALKLMPFVLKIYTVYVKL